MKNDSLAIVPLNVDKLEGIGINKVRNLTGDDKKRLLEILRKKLQENRAMLGAKRDEVVEAILEAEKSKSGLSKFRKDMDELEEQIRTLSDRRAIISTRCENATGFTISGELVKDMGCFGRGSDDEHKLWLFRHRQAMAKADAIRTKMELARQQVDRFGLKFDKVETRLVLATTIGEAMEIMDAVLGNGDNILDADPVVVEAED